MRSALVVALLIAFAGLAVAQAEINLENATIETLIKLISRKSGKNFLYDANDPILKQPFRFVTPPGVPIKDEALYRFFESILTMKGYTLVDFPDFTKILKSGEVSPSDSAIVNTDQAFALKDEERLVTMFYKLEYISAQEMLGVLNQVKSRNGRVIKVQEDSLIVYDLSANVDKMVSLMKSLDVKPAATVTKVINLKFAQSQDLQAVLTRVFAPGRRNAAQPQGGQPQPGSDIIIHADRRLNALILSGLVDDVNAVEELVGKLDIQPEVQQAEIHIIPMKNGDAEDIAKKLQDVYADKQKRAATAQGGDQASIMEKIPSIVPHEGTNSIIVISPPDVFNEVKAVVDKLDRQRDKVLIEALIVELTLDKLHDFGIELASVKMSAEADYNAFGGALFGMSKITVNADGNYGKVPVPSNVAGMFGGLAYKNDMSLLPLLIVAAKEDRNVSICGQPQIVANDNEEASFESNIQVPTLKTNIGASGEIISQSAEYHTASMLLKIVPHITEENFLRLEIEQNSERFDLATALTNLPPTKTARKTKTTVTIPDRATVLLGGLKSEDGSWTVKKVPVLGDIPFLRYFFRRQTWTENESTVFVFITATIIRSNEEYETMSSVKLDAIEKLRQVHSWYKSKKPAKKD